MSKEIAYHEVLHHPVAVEQRQALALRAAFFTTALLVIVGLGGYFLGRGQRLEAAQQTERAADANSSVRGLNPVVTIPAPLSGTTNARTDAAPPSPTR